MKRLRSLALALVPCLVMAAPSPHSPTETVRRATEAIIAVLQRDDLPREERWAEVGRVIDANFDFQSMSQSVLATNWRKADPVEKQQFVEYFSQYLEATYRDRIESYDDQEIRYLGERVDGDLSQVDTVIVAGDTEIPVSYRLRLTGDRWKAYDVLIEGRSLVASYRDTFAAIVRSEGMDGLLGDLQRRLAAHRARQGKQGRSD